MIPSGLNKPARVPYGRGVRALGQQATGTPWEGGYRAGVGGRPAVPAGLGCVRAAGGGAWGSAGGPPYAGRERFLQSRLSAKGARRRPGERSSAGASGGLLPAGNGKADAVWSSTRQTATTSHNFILESRPAAAPARAGERTGGGALGREAQGAASPRVPGPRSKLVTALLRDGCSPALPWASRALLPSPQLTPRSRGRPRRG